MDNRKGIILAGGLGTRLYPITRVTNKHLLPVYDWPMVFYPINTLKLLDITDICVIVGGNSVGDILDLLGDGSQFGVQLTYKHQREPLGIAHALGLAEDFVGESDIAVCLGDNIFLKKIPVEQDIENAVLILVESDHPQDFGCVVFSDEPNKNSGYNGIYKEEEYDRIGKQATVTEVVKNPWRKVIAEVIEKPSVEYLKNNPDVNKIVTGLYFYPNDVFSKVKRLSPSDRGELEISDINNMYIKEGRIDYIEVGIGTWYDAGSIDDIVTATNKVLNSKKSGLFDNALGKIK